MAYHHYVVSSLSLVANPVLKSVADINVTTPDFFCVVLCISFRADLLGTDSPFKDIILLSGTSGVSQQNLWSFKFLFTFVFQHFDYDVDSPDFV